MTWCELIAEMFAPGSRGAIVPPPAIPSQRLHGPLSRSACGWILRRTGGVACRTHPGAELPVPKHRFAAHPCRWNGRCSCLGSWDSHAIECAAFALDGQFQMAGTCGKATADPLVGEEKRVGYRKWQEKWDKWIDDVVEHKYC